MTDILSAKQIKAERTGNGRRESFRYLPIPRMTNTFIDNGKDKPADILASTKSGLYVKSLSGGSVNPITGVFNFTCREAYLIEDGKKTVPVKGATLIGSCLDIIQNIDAVADDLDFGPGICGKGQAAEVTAGQPTVRLRGINVGGTRAAPLRDANKEPTMDNKALAEQLVKQSLKKGADAAEVYIQSGRELSIEVRNGDIETVQEAATAGAGIRVFVEGRMAFACSNDLREASLDDAIGRAIGFAKITTADPNQRPSGRPRRRSRSPASTIPRSPRCPSSARSSWPRRSRALALKVPGVTKSAGSAFREGEDEVVIANSLGILKSHRASGCAFGVSVVAEKGEQKSSGGESCGRRFFADLKKPEEVAAKAAKEAVEMLDPKMVKTQKAAVIFDPDVAGALLGGILGGDQRRARPPGRELPREEARPEDRLRPPDRHRRRHPAQGPGQRPVRRRRRHDPEARHHREGRPQGLPLQHDRGQARRGQEHRQRLARRIHRPPGHRTAQFLSWRRERPSPRTSSRRPRPGCWLKEITGYGINPVNGQFSGGAAGFWIEDGKIAFPVKGLTVAGTAEEMFNGIDMLGDDLDLNRGTTAPTFRIKLLQIGGE